MNVLYIGDFRELPNWGCRSTGIALAELIVSQHKIIDAVGLEALHWTGWHSYEQPGIRYDSIIPRRIFDFVWRHRNGRASLADAYMHIEKRLGAKLDFVSENPSESVRRFHIARRENQRLQELFDSANKCDAIVINGEGTMIFSKIPRRDVLFNLFVIALANELEKPVYFLNAMFSECPYTGLNEQTVSTAASLLSTCKTIVCRDRWSHSFVKKYVDPVSVTTIPDALFTWSTRIETAANHIAHNADIVLPYHFEKLIGTIAFDRPYIGLAGSSSAWRKGRECINTYERIARKLQHLGLPVYLICTCVGDNFLHEVGQRTGLKVIPYEIPVMGGAAIVSRASVFVSGRFHPSIMASAGGTPCVFFGSNSHKTKSLQEVLEYPEHREFSDLPEPHEDKDILIQVEERLAQGNNLRNQIRSVVGRRHQQALSVVDVVNGQFVHPLL